MSHPILGFMQERHCAGVTLRALTMPGRGHLLEKGFSADFTPGKIHCMEAPNGSGKSSILMCIAGLDIAGSGSIELNGGEGSINNHAAVISWLPPNDDFPLPVSALDVVLAGRWRFGGGSSPLDRDVAMECLAALGIAGLRDRSTDSLSTGQKRRVNLARAFAQDADILLLDEPFSGLDDEGCRLVDACLDRLISLGRTVIVARPK